MGGGCLNLYVFLKSFMYGKNILDFLNTRAIVIIIVTKIIRKINDMITFGRASLLNGNIKYINSLNKNPKTSPRKYSYKNLINYVVDRLGHDKRYAIDASKISNELGWKPEYSFRDGLKITISWYINKFNK